MLILKNAKIVPGDGKKILEDSSLVIEGNKIVDIFQGDKKEIQEQEHKVIDCKGKVVMPGMINHHQHCIVDGPNFASGAKPRGMEKVVEQLDRNLEQGCTTVLNVDGFITMDEVERTQKHHPLRIKTATTHTPLNFDAADKLDASGLQEKHRNTTVENMLDAGAVAIGEVGGGHTLGGGGQDYIYIPREIKKITGKEIDSLEARALKLAVLGRYIEESACDMEEVERVLEEINLADDLSPQGAKEIVVNTVLPSVNVTLEGYKEAAELAKKFDVPMIAHNAPTSMKMVHEIADMGINKLIAAHSNYLFNYEESLENTRKLRRYEGVIIDAAVHDPFGAQKLVSTPENMFAFFEEGLADIVSTDYAAGRFDSMLTAFEKAIEKEKLQLAQAISLGTQKVAEAIPGLAPNRGLLAKGYDADIVISDYPGISQVNKVIIDGEIVFDTEQGGKCSK